MSIGSKAKIIFEENFSTIFDSEHCSFSMIYPPVHCCPVAEELRAVGGDGADRAVFDWSADHVWLLVVPEFSPHAKCNTMMV